MWGGERVKVRVYLADGTPGDRWTVTARDEGAAELALRIAAQLPSGCRVRLASGGLMWTYRVGRIAGLPSVTWEKGWKPPPRKGLIG